MKIVSMIQAAAMAVTVSTLSLHAQPIDETFTYQGKLLESGADANGNYNIRVTLEDQAGVLIAGPEEMLSVPVIDGLFSIDLNFGSALYSADRRYLKIEVFESGAGYVELSPRTPINATPLAAVAMRSLDNEFTRVGNDLMIGDTDERILMNPDTVWGDLIDSSTMVQVNYDGNANASGGIDINSSASTSNPFYGFALEGGREAKIEYDGGLNMWIGTQQLPSFEVKLDKVFSNVGFETPSDVSTTGTGDFYKEYSGPGQTQRMQVTPVAFGTTTSDNPSPLTTFGSGNFTVTRTVDGIGIVYRVDIPEISYNNRDYTLIVNSQLSTSLVSTIGTTGGDFYVRFYSFFNVNTRVPGKFSFVMYKNTPMP